MPKNKARKESGKATLAGLKKEMARPRVAKSARKKYAKLALPVVLPEAENRLVAKQQKATSRAGC